MATSFPLIEVAGDSFRMGYQHGKQARPLIGRYLDWIERLTGQPRSLLCANALRFVPAIQQLSHAFIDEVFGLAEGAGISFGEAMLCQVRSEAAHRWEGGCTAFALRGAATATGEVLAGQNQDLESEFEELAVILKVAPSDGRPRAVMMTFAGQLGYAGMNQHGVANFTNALYNFRWQSGMPFYPLRRMMLEQRSVQQCIDLVQRHRSCSAANFVLCDGRGNIGDVEVRPNGVAIFKGENTDCRLHTNHYLTKQFAQFEDGTLPDSPQRLARFQELVHLNWGKINPEILRNLMSDHQSDPAAVCRHGAQNLRSVSGYIAEPAKSIFHVRRGQGCTGTWTQYKV